MIMPIYKYIANMFPQEAKGREGKEMAREGEMKEREGKGKSSHLLLVLAYNLLER